MGRGDDVDSGGERRLAGEEEPRIGGNGGGVYRGSLGGGEGGAIIRGDSTTMIRVG